MKASRMQQAILEALLKKPEPSMTALARTIGHPRPSVSRAFQLMEQEGWVCKIGSVVALQEVGIERLKSMKFSSKNALLRGVIEELCAALEIARREHLVVEDCWYSCPLSGEACVDGAFVDKTKCNCGADYTNVIIDRALDHGRRAIDLVPMSTLITGMEIDRETARRDWFNG